MKPTRGTRLFGAGLFGAGLFGIALLAAILTGCGLKGQLYLPAPDDNASTATTTAPDQASEPKDSEESEELADPDKPADGR